MSILSGARIRQALEERDDLSKRLVITPFFDASKQIDEGAGSVDLRLGCRFSAARRRRMPSFPVDEKGLHPAKLIEEHYVPLNGDFVLHPQHFVLATTLEWVRLPPIYAGYLIGRSSYGRLGLIVATAIGIQPGYSGVLTLELANVSEIPLQIKPGRAICQLFIHEVAGWSADRIDRSAFLGSIYPRPGWPETTDVDRFLGSFSTQPDSSKS